MSFITKKSMKNRQQQFKVVVKKQRFKFTDLPKAKPHELNAILHSLKYPHRLKQEDA